jgi:aspartyl/asparaginyl beta-hydroxylase (cupin superfamily)
MTFLTTRQDIKSILEKNYKEIRKEYLSLSKDDFIDFHSIEEMLINPRNTGHYWQVSLLVWNKEISSITLEKLKKSKTLEMIFSLPVMPTVAVFSKLLPGGHIEKHGDYDDVFIENLPIPEEYEYRETGLIKYHLALDVPSVGECAIIIEDNKKIIKNGDIYAFDEGSCHEAYNYSDSERGVLIISFMKKDLNVTE